MKKEKVIFADPDKEYLNFLEGLVVPELEEQVDVILISSFQYFQKYTNVLEKNVLLFAWKEWGMELRQKTDSGNLFLIGEEEEENIPVFVRSWDERKIIKKIKTEIANFREANKEKIQRTKTLLVYSPLGGSGVSSVALGSAQYLAEKGDKVFFIGADTWQDYRCAVNQIIEKKAEEFFITCPKGGFQTWENWIWHGSFDALPPFAQSYQCLGLTPEFFREIEREVKETEKYDWIIVETDHAYQEWITRWMADADKVILVIKHGKKWKELISVMGKSISMKEREKFCFLSNFFQETETEEEEARKLGWESECFLREHRQTQEDWKRWRSGLGEILDEK